MNVISALVFFFGALFNFAFGVAAALCALGLAILQMIFALAYIVIIVCVIGGIVIAVKLFIALAMAALL